MDHRDPFFVTLYVYTKFQMLHHSRQWLFNVLRKLVLDNPFIRRLIRGLLVLYSILRHRFRGRRPSNEGSRDGATFPPQSVRSGLPCTDASSTCTSTGITSSPIRKQQPPQTQSHNPYLGLVGDPSISPSYAPGSLHQSLLPEENTSRSSQDLGILSMEEYTAQTRNVSDRHLSSPPSPSEDTARGPSPNATILRAASPSPEPILSLDPTNPTVRATILRPDLSSAHPGIFPIAPMAFERRSRNVPMHVHLSSNLHYL